jgi:diadenosine tetraphosphate (Ap4A) HIT family hydrolase
MECVLCESFVSEPDRVVHQDEHVFVLVNIEPVKEGHIMVLPVRHVEQLGDLAPQEAQAFLKAVDACMHGVTVAYGETPMCMVNGWGHRTQRHLHAHVLPSKNSLRGLFSASEGLEERKRADAPTLKRMAERLRPFFQRVREQG